MSPVETLLPPGVGAGPGSGVGVGVFKLTLVSTVFDTFFSTLTAEASPTFGITISSVKVAGIFALKETCIF